MRLLREKHLRRDSARDSEAGDFRTSDRFQGDDEEVLVLLAAYPGTHPSPVTRAQARLLCQNFDASGHSNHSGRGSTPWVIPEHCAQADIPHTLRASPGLGYYVERSSSVGDGLALSMSVETRFGLPPE